MSANRRTTSQRRTALVLGGGGLKGFAHIGVLRALEERGIAPSLYAGTSIGSLIAAAHAGGLATDEMERRALAVKKRELFRIDHMAMLLERMRARAIYTGEPLRALVESSVPSGTLAELPRRLLVNTVDLRRGTQVVWGLPGLRDVSVADAVYASCALPGYFPPGVVDGRTCVDGGVIDNLPASIAAIGSDAVIAVDVGNSDIVRGGDPSSHGFAEIYMRAATVMMHALQTAPLATWTGPPMILIRPRVSHIPWLSFSHTAELIDEGYRAARSALESVDQCLDAAGGVWPRFPVRLSVNRERCIGCGLCVAMAPSMMGLDRHRKAFARAHAVDWSPADGEFVHHCPTLAIEAVREDGRPHIVTGDAAMDETSTRPRIGRPDDDDEETSAA